MTTPSVDFYWDPASPYTYLAATQIRRIAEATGATFHWKPFLLGFVFKATGNAPPVNIKAKGAYMPKDLALWARHTQVPFTFPASFPVNSIAPTRFALAAEQHEKGVDAALALMHAHWGEGKDISDAAVLAGIAGDLGLDAGQITEAMGTDAIKAQLKTNTDEAVQRGAFGAPTFFVGDTMLWGNDRLVLLEEILKGNLAA